MQPYELYNAPSHTVLRHRKLQSPTPEAGDAKEKGLLYNHVNENTWFVLQKSHVNRLLLLSGRFERLPISGQCGRAGEVFLTMCPKSQLPVVVGRTMPSYESMDVVMHLSDDDVMYLQSGNMPQARLHVEQRLQHP